VDTKHLTWKQLGSMDGESWPLMVCTVGRQAENRHSPCPTDPVGCAGVLSLPQPFFAVFYQMYS